MSTASHLVAVIGRMKNDGKRDKEIAMAVGLPVRRVEYICSAHGWKKPSNGRVDVALGVKLKSVYQAEAARREMNLNTMMRVLLKNISDDNLFAALLDDKK